jgi:ubiquinone/menaquinone biosynthesis C-methylase UbiE
MEHLIMALETTYQIERAKWDSLAQQEVSAEAPLPANEDFHRYARRSATMPGVSEFLGDLHGKQVLEYGCGLGSLSLRLAKSGAQVTSFDLSAASIAVAHRRAALNELTDQIQLTVAAGEYLPYADESFDVIVGKAILHHLDVNVGWPDFYRVLRRGGKAAFVEPMGMNPLLNFARERIAYPHKNPRGADRPLHYDEILAWGHQFSRFRYHEIQLLSMLERGMGFGKRLPTLRRMDNSLLTQLPFLRRYCRYVVMFMVK